jgi:endonuclease/exonuclease/phosphatase family metal-dependent hydrolase
MSKTTTTISPYPCGGGFSFSPPLWWGARLALRTALALLIFFGVSSCSDGEKASFKKAQDDGLDLQVMSFNIRYGTANDGENRWQKRRRLVFDVLRKHQPDIVGLQEVLHFQLEEICQATPDYCPLGVGRDDGKTKGEYCAILYRRDRFDIDESGIFWFSDTPEVPGSITWGNAYTRICTWARFIEKKSGRACYLFNVHLDHVSQPSREKSSVLLTQRIYSRTHLDPFIVTGDFNSGEENPVILYLKGKVKLVTEEKGEFENPVPMVDTFRVLHSDAIEVGTFNGFEGRRAGEKIDYVFAQAGVEVLEARILDDNDNGCYPSDHFPVTACILLPIREVKASTAKTQSEVDVAR